jgi:hypothetical protein
LLDFIVSVCHPKHLAAWREAQARIPSCLPSREHVLVVPDDSVDDFERVTGETIRVEPESLHAAPYSERLRDDLRRIGESRRYGSYVQQLIKLGALRGRPDGERLLIWDADTVPLRRLDFFGDDGLVRFYSEHRAHEPMFVQVERLLGLQKATKRSFIAQCFPIRSEWANAFFATLEHDGEPWYDRILASIPFDRGSGISEYELLGTFIAHRYASKIEWIDDAWLRNGYAFARSNGSAVDLGAVPRAAHFVALEDYDRPEVSRVPLSVDPLFEPTPIRNRRISAQLSGACARLVRADETAARRSRLLFIGLAQEAQVLLPLDSLAERGIDLEMVSPVSHEALTAPPWSRIWHGVPAAESGETEVCILDASSSLSSAGDEARRQHPTDGLLVSPRLSHLACRFWMELVDWSEEDLLRVAELDAARRVMVPAIDWRELLRRDGGGDDVVVIALPGFEREVVGSFVESLSQSEASRVCQVGFVSLYRDEALFARLEELGFAFTAASAQPDDAEPILWSFERRTSASFDSGLSLPDVRPSPRHHGSSREALTLD